METNKALVKQYYAAINAHDVAGASQLIADGLVNHAAIPEAQGRAGMVRIGEKLLRAFPDGKFEVQDLIAEGDRVVARGVFRGTNTGTLDFVRLPMTATGRRVEVDHVHVFRIEGGKIVEHWACRDDISYLRQLGVLPKAVS